MFVKKLAIMFFLFIVLTGFVFADLGDNFKAAGYRFLGGLSFYLDGGNIFAENNQLNYFSMNLYPEVGFLLIDKLAIWVQPNFYFEKHFSDNSNYWSAGFNTGFSYYFLQDPKAKSGLVPAFSFSLSPSCNSNSDIYFVLHPGVRAFYFITETIAPYVSIAPSFFIPIYEGTGFDTDNISMSFRTHIGISYWIPNKDVVLLKK